MTTNTTLHRPTTTFSVCQNGHYFHIVYCHQAASVKAERYLFAQQSHGGTTTDEASEWFLWLKSMLSVPFCDMPLLVTDSKNLHQLSRRSRWMWKNHMAASWLKFTCLLQWWVSVRMSIPELLYAAPGPSKNLFIEITEGGFYTLDATCITKTTDWK